MCLKKVFMKKISKTALDFKKASLKRDTLFSLFLLVIGFTWLTSEFPLLAQFGGFLVLFSAFAFMFFISACLYYWSYAPEHYDRVMAQKGKKVSQEGQGMGKFVILFLGVLLGFGIGVLLLAEPSNQNMANESANYSVSGKEKGLIGGTWQSSTPIGDKEYLTFSAEGLLSITDGMGSSMEAPYETTELVEPYQLYIYLEYEGKNERLPLGIYKVEGDTMLFRDVIEIHRAIGFIDVGVSRYEMPKDFSLGAKTYQRIGL